jgi:hypothetical protein
MKRTLLIILLLLVSLVIKAQQQNRHSQDVESIESIIASLYNVISGEPGVDRDWVRFRNLFKPEAKLIPTRKDDEGGFIIKPMSPEEYIGLFSSRISTGFFEKELNRKTEEYGTIAHVFSTYETKEKKDGPVTNRGINSIQLFKDKDRYYIVNVYWCAESMGFVLPEKYLKQ